MTVTELATLTILSPHSASSPSIISFIQKLVKLQSSASGEPGLSVFQQVENPQILYLIGHWESLAAHESWIASEKNQSLLKALSGLLELESFYHINVPKNLVPINAPVLSIARLYLKADVQKDMFEKVYANARNPLEEYTKPFTVAAGWRIEESAAGQNEWVAFSGFKSVEEHFEFPKTDGWKEHEKVKRADVKHGTDFSKSLGAVEE